MIWWLRIPLEKIFCFRPIRRLWRLYEQVNGKPVKSEIVFNTPIVLYTRSAVAQALVTSEIASVQDRVFYVDMEKLTAEIEQGTSWADLGLPQLYGSVTVGTTDPTQSNSGNMFAGLIANTLSGGVADQNNVNTILPRLQDIFQKLGYMESSSADLFDQFLKPVWGPSP